MRYYRIHTADIAYITQQPRGIFTAIGKLVDAGILSEEETAEYWKNRAYFEKVLPVLQSASFFHSERLFAVVEKTPSEWPYMVIAYDGDVPVAHLLVILRRRGSLIPPYLFTQARIYGEGVYADGYDKEELFAHMLQSVAYVY